MTDSSHRCPTCRGAKTQTLTVTEWRPGGDDSTTTQKIECATCDGAGTVTDEQLEEARRYAEMWCRCEEGAEPYYMADGEHPLLTKHHWRCSDCDGVTQIG